MKTIKQFTGVKDFSDNFSSFILSFVESVKSTSIREINISINPETNELYEAEQSDVFNLISISKEDLVYDFDITGKIAQAKFFGVTTIIDMNKDLNQ